MLFAYHKTKKKPKVRQVLKRIVHLVVVIENKQIHGSNCFTNTDKEIFLLNQNPTCANYGIYVATCLIYHQHYTGQTKNTFFLEMFSESRYLEQTRLGR